MRHTFLLAVGLLIVGSISLQAQDRDLGMQRIVLDDDGTGAGLNTLTIGLSPNAATSIEWILPGTLPPSGGPSSVLGVVSQNGSTATLGWIQIIQGNEISPEDGGQVDNLLLLVKKQQEQIDALKARLDALESGTVELTVEADAVDVSTD